MNKHEITSDSTIYRKINGTENWETFILDHRLAYFFFFLVASQIVNNLGFAGHRVSVAITQLCYWSTNTAIEQHVNEWVGCVPLKLWAKAGAPLGSGCHLLTPVVDLAEISHGAALSFIFLIYKMQILLAALWLHQCEDVLMENLWTFLEISFVLLNIKLVVNIVIFFPKLLYLISLLSFIPFLGNCNHFHFGLERSLLGSIQALLALISWSHLHSVTQGMLFYTLSFPYPTI